MSTYSINPNRKFTIKIITLLFFLMLGTAEAMKAQFTVTVTVSPAAGGTISHEGGTWSGNTGTYASGETATITARPNAGWMFDKWVDGGTTSNDTTISITSNKNLTAYFAPISIGSSTEWDYFCDAIANGCRYSNKIVTLTNNITIDRMAGKKSSPNGADGTPFRGTFDGDGYTMTLNGGDFGTSESPITEDYRAPFYRVENNATIKNLTVNGDIYMGGNGKYAGGLIATATTTNTIENCVSAVNIHSSVSGDGFCGGFLGTISKRSNSRIIFKGCAFVGQLLGTNASCWGGFVGYRDYQTGQLNYADFTNCLCAPTAVNINNDNTSSTFCRSYNSTTDGTTFTNCYYLTPIQNADGGKQAYSISAGDYITVARSGSATTTYNVSGITAYSKGIIYNGTLYGGSSESIGLSLSYYNPGELLAGYTAINGTLTGSAITGTNDAYTLSSITGNVIINAGESEPFTVSATASPSPSGVNTVQVTTTSGTSGSQGTTSSAEVNPGADVTLTATAGANWVFYKWSDGTNTYTSNPLTVNSAANYTAYFVPIRISNATEWGYFCDAIDNGCTYNGLTVTLTNNINIDRMAGKVSSPDGKNGTPFKGTFNGNGHTITLSGGDFGTSASPITVKYRAPFYRVENARLENLTVNGDIYMDGTNGKYAGGLIASATGTNTTGTSTVVYNCVSAVNIYVNGSDASSGGFVGIISSPVPYNGSITFEGCAFVGQLASPSGKAYSWGGFVGWRDQDKQNYAHFINCLCAPTTTDIKNSNTSIFCRSKSNSNTGNTYTNCYYAPSNPTIFSIKDGGQQAYSISAGDYITVACSGSPTATYNVSGITAYSTGIIYNGTLYGGPSDTIDLSLSYTNPGHPLSGYTAINGTLTGSAITSTNDEYALSSITGNVTINAIGNLPFTVSATASPSPSGVNTVLVTTTDGTSGSPGASSSAMVLSGADVTITATAGANWIFYKWNNGNTNDTITLSNVTSPASYTAYFAPTNISNDAEWGYFCDAVNDGFSYSGMTVTLSNDITINRVAGNNISNPFMGTFDGQGHTMTISGGDFGTSVQNTSIKFCAPFQYVDGGTFINLRVDGDTYTYAKFTSGLIGSAAGTINVRNCVSALNIHSAVPGDGSHGGFLGIIDNDGSSITFEGCAFVGQLLGSSTHNCGGFIGWREYRSGEHQSFNTATFINCFSAATAVTLNMLTTGNSRTFGRERARTGATYTNCYYTTTIQGNNGGSKQAYTITGDDGVSVTIQGTDIYYNVSNITTYGTNKGIDFNGTHYAANGENVDLQLSYTPPVDHHITGYFASDGGILSGTALTGNDDAYTLTMPASNTIIEVTTSRNSTWVAAVTTNPSVGNYETDGSGNVTIRSNRGLAWLISVVNGLNGQTADNLSGKTVTLTENVDMNEYIWVPIGTPEHAFAGTFDGGCHTIDGLHIIASEESVAGAPANTGLLGFTVSGATIKNTLVVDSHFFNSNLSGNIGGIVGNNAGTIHNSFSDVTLSGSAPNKGGLAGTNSGTLRHSYTMVISGIYGSNSGTVTNCYSKAASDATPGTGFTAPNYEYGKYDKNNTVIVSGTPEPLVDLLNNGNNDGKWILPKGSTHVNGGYPVLIPESNMTGEALAVASNSGTKALYYGTASEMITKYNSGASQLRPADVYIYGSGDLGSTVPNNAFMHLFIDEDASITQNDIAGAITATVGITIDNSANNGNMGRDWHTFATPLADVPLGITYPFPDDVIPFDAINDTVHYQMDFSGGYFTSDLNSYKIDVDFYDFHEPQYHWINLKRNPVSHWHEDGNHAHIEDYTSSASLVPGNGYLLAIGDNTAAKKEVYMNATGTLKDGNVSITVTNQGAHLAGYNFLGNPYQSYLDFNEFANENRLVLWNDASAIGYRSYLIYDADEGEFVESLIDENSVGFSQGSVRTTNQFIHPHQGFFVVKNTSGDRTVVFNNTMRNTTGSSSYRDAQPNYPLVNLICTDSDGKREVSVIEVNRPSMAGAIKMKELLNSKAYMYIRWGNEDFSSMFIDHTPEYLPIWFKSIEEGVFTLTWSTANQDFENLHIIDNLTGADIDMLATDSYTFQSKPTDSKARFRLAFSPLGIEEEETTEAKNFAFISNGELIVTGSGELSLIDINGRVLTTEHIAGEQSRISVPLAADGLYILRLASNKGVKMQKIVIRR